MGLNFENLYGSNTFGYTAANGAQLYSQTLEDKSQYPAIFHRDLLLASARFESLNNECQLPSEGLPPSSNRDEVMLYLV